MPSQLVAFATQSRKPGEVAELEELDEAVPHMLFSVSLQLSLPTELELELELELVPTPPGRHVWHLAMMLSTALSHFVLGVQLVTTRNENSNPRNDPMEARFMFPHPTNLMSPVYRCITRAVHTLLRHMTCSIAEPQCATR